MSQPNYNYNVFSLNPSTPATPSLLGGRSRLHLIDFGCCERTKTLGGSITQVNLAIHNTDELTSAQAGLGNVILGVLNGQRHLPFKESRVTQLLREVLGSVSCQVGVKKSQRSSSASKNPCRRPSWPTSLPSQAGTRRPCTQSSLPRGSTGCAAGRCGWEEEALLLSVSDFLFLGGRGERGWQWKWQQ